MRNRLSVFEEQGRLVIEINPAYAESMRNLERGFYAAAIVLLLWTGVELAQWSTGGEYGLTPLYAASICGLAGLFTPRPLRVRTTFNPNTHTITVLRSARKLTRSRTINFADVESIGLDRAENEDGVFSFAAVLRLTDGSTEFLSDAMTTCAPNIKRLDYIAGKTGLARKEFCS